MTSGVAPRPMTHGNIRQNGVRFPLVYCLACRRDAVFERRGGRRRRAGAGVRAPRGVHRGRHGRCRRPAELGRAALDGGHAVDSFRGAGPSPGQCGGSAAANRRPSATAPDAGPQHARSVGRPQPCRDRARQVGRESRVAKLRENVTLGRRLFHAMQPLRQGSHGRKVNKALIIGVRMASCFPFPVA